jgi:hypothetical protein
MWPLARQLALKALLDPLFFDLDKINEILAPAGCPNPPKRVTAEEVLYWIVNDTVFIKGGAA